MQYYYFENILWDKFFASGILNFTKINDEKIECPKCKLSTRYKLFSPFELELSNANFGDVVHVDGMDLIVSERFKSIYYKSNLKGIEEFIPINKVIVKRNRNKLEPPKYYYARLKWIKANYDPENVNIQNAINSFANSEHICEVCDTLGRRDINGYKIIINESDSYDVFNSYEIKNILMSQNFVDWCLENGISNVKAKFTRTEDHTCYHLLDDTNKHIELINNDLIKRLEKFGEY